MRRIPELDALRGIAAVAIVVFHLKLKDRLPYLGTLVDLFFVLSGYLITTILLEMRGTPRVLRNFYARRSLRIWPIYYLALGAAAVINAFLRRPAPIGELGRYLTYTQFVQGYWKGAIPSLNSLVLHTWTLAIEEQFYLIWPLVVLLTGRRFLPLAIAPLLIVPTPLRALGYVPNLLLTRCEGLALGALLAYLMGARRWSGRKAPSVALGVIVAVALGYGSWATPLLDAMERARPSAPWFYIRWSLDESRVCALYFGVVGLVLRHAGSPWLAPLRHRALTYAGTISYGLYLYHPLIFVGLGLVQHRLGLRGSIAIDAMKLAACVAVAAVSWRRIERPILALKDRFAYAPRAGAYRGPHAQSRPGVDGVEGSGPIAGAVGQTEA